MSTIDTHISEPRYSVKNLGLPCVHCGYPEPATIHHWAGGHKYEADPDYDRNKQPQHYANPIKGPSLSDAGEKADV